MKTIKIIDLYNLIANEEFDKLPKKVKYRSVIFVLEKRDDFINYKPKEGDWLLNQFLWKLNDEVEILEEEPRDIEVCGSLFTKSEYDKLAHREEPKKIPEKLDINLGIAKMTPTEKYISNTVNEILDYLESKGDE